MISAIKTATRQKHRPLNSYVSLSRPVYDDEFSERTLVDVLESVMISKPEDIVIDKEELSIIEGRYRKRCPSWKSRCFALP
jgi:RNA polymerase sporulation-specific sigma factor